MPPSRLLIALLILAVVSAPTTGAAASIDRPVWTPGDFWTYRTNTTLAPGLGLTGEATSTVTGTLAAADGSPAGSYRIVVAGSGTATGSVITPNGSVSIQGRWTLTGEERYEPDNLRLVYSLIDLSVNGTYRYIIPVPFSLRFQNTTTFRILQAGWRYPEAVGASNIVSVAYNFTQDVYSPTAGHFHDNGTGQRDLAFSVDNVTSVTTEAGSFEAFVIREDALDGTLQKTFYAPRVGNDVRTESYDAGGNLTSVGTLNAYRYQAAETPTFLGLTALQWTGVGAFLGAAAVSVVLIILRARRRRRALPPGGDARDPTSGPRGP